MRLSLKAIAVGGVVDIVATNIATLPVYVGILTSKGVIGATEAQTTRVIQSSLDTSPTLYTSMMLLGSLCSILGGWVAARIAKRDELLHGALSPFLCVGFGLYGWVRGSSPDVSTAEHLAFLVLSPALGAFGGVLRVWAIRHGLVSAPSPGGVPAEPVITGWKRVVYVIDRVLQWIALFVLAVFAMMALFARGAGDRNALLGGMMLAVIGGVLALLYFLAARALAQGRQHWPLHAAAVGVTLVPIALIGIGMATR